MNVQSITPAPVVATPEGGREDLYSKLLSNRIIMVHGQFNPVMAAKVIPQILHLATEESSDPLEIHINSPGGSVLDGFGIYDAIRQFKRRTDCEVHTYVMGSACSMGAFLFSIGDKRYVGEHSSVMVHQASGGFHGHVVESREQARQLELTNERLLKIMAERCGKTFEEMAAIREDLWLFGQEAVDWGIADETF
jgi:ATP-dependent Clp protease, protease subunit